MKINITPQRELIDEITAIAPLATFASLVYRSKTDDSVARYSIILGANYIKLIESSILELELTGEADLWELAREKQIDFDLLIEAKNEILDSLKESRQAKIDGVYHSRFTKPGLYAPIGSGLSINKNDLSLQLYGLRQGKKVLIPGKPDTRKRRPLTIAKDILRKRLPIGRFREFALDLGQCYHCRMKGKTLTLSNVAADDLARIYQEHKEKAKISIGKVKVST